MMNPSHPSTFLWRPWRIFLAGTLLALSLVAFMMWGVMNAPWKDTLGLITLLAISSLLSLVFGYLIYRRGLAHSPSLRFTFISTYTWAALLTLFNVWVLTRPMFVSQHDLVLSGLLLLFSAIIATTLGIFVANNVSEGLQKLADTAQEVAQGTLTARVAIQGRDELAQAGLAFNEMAAQLQTAAHQREELDSLRRDLIAWTSHDLRTPLTSIRAMVEALHDGVVDDPEITQRYYRTIRNDVIALNRLIDDLFELAQMDAGGFVLEKSPHSLGDLLSDTLESFQALAEQNNITLAGEISPNLDPVTLNAPKIGRVLANLISNALRYTPKGGRVYVMAQRLPEGVRVTVSDSGPGFAPQDLPRVFEKFYRGEQARSRSTGGAGLGLAIAAGIVAAHNGRIWAENLPTQGAQVGFLLPT